jgi:hypothetical protein
MSKKWYENIDWKKVTKEHADYALTEANAHLKTSLESCSELDKKSFFIITGSIGYVSVLLPFIFKSTDNVFIIPSSILVAGFFIALLMLVHSIKAQKYFPMGNYPKNTLSPESLEGNYENFLHWEIISRQKWIEHNENINKAKGKLINFSLISLLGSIFVAFISYLIVTHCP